MRYVAINNIIPASGESFDLGESAMTSLPWVPDVTHPWLPGQ